MGRPEILKNVKNVNKDFVYKRLSQEKEMTLKCTKEIVIKFIEMGRCSPASFEDVFSQVYKTIKKTLEED